MSEETIKHFQQTFLSLGDEFFIQYLLCGDSRFRSNQILSRLFSMGHSLELYLKAALVSPAGVAPHGHNVAALSAQFDPALSLSHEEVAAGKALFASDVRNVDIGIWMKHEEALELYQAQHFLMNLKYYLDRDQKVIYPARGSLRPINARYLDLVRRVRTSVTYRDSHQDQVLAALVGQLGLADNPALKVM